MQKVQIDTETINVKMLKHWLQQGDIKEAATRRGLSLSSAYKTITGEVKNFDFLAELYERAIDNRTRFRALQARLENAGLQQVNS